MSMTLDMHNEVNRDVSSLGPYDVPWQRDGYSNIFDEIEHLMNFNQNLEQSEGISNYPQDLQSPAVDSDDISNSISIDSDDISTHIDSKCLHTHREGDPLLLIVEGDGLLPFTSKHVNSGIYKKFPNIKNDSNVKPAKTLNNVYYSNFETHGRIVRQQELEELYTEKQEVYEPPPCKVFLVESVADDNELLQDDFILKSKCDDALNVLSSNILRNEIVRTEQNSQGKPMYRFLEPPVLHLSTQQNDIEIGVKENITESIQSPQTGYYKDKLPRTLKRKLEHDKSDEKIVQIKQIQYSNEEGLDVVSSYSQSLLSKDFEYVSSKFLNNIKIPTVLTQDSQLTSFLTTVDPQDSAKSKPQFSHSESLINMSNTSTDSVQEVSLFQFLIDKLQNFKDTNQADQVELFLDELNDFVNQLQTLSANLIRSTGGEHFINSHISNLLCIPEGQYTLDLSALETSSQTSTLYSNSNNNDWVLNYTNVTMGSSGIPTDKAIAKESALSDDGFYVCEGNLLQTSYGITYNNINSNQYNLYPFEPILTAGNPYAAHAFSSSNGGNAGEVKHILEASSISADASIPQLDLSADYFQFNN